MNVKMAMLVAASEYERFTLAEARSSGMALSSRVGVLAPGRVGTIRRSV